MVDLYDAASEAAHRMEVTLILFRHREKVPLDSHGGYTQQVVQDVVTESRDLLRAGMKAADHERVRERAAEKTGGAR